MINIEEAHVIVNRIYEDFDEGIINLIEAEGRLKRFFKRQLRKEE